MGGSNVITDESGKQTARYEYTPYGEVPESNIALPSSPIKHLFTGKELDDSTGLYDYGARMYDPVVGRFVTADPLRWDDKTLRVIAKKSLQQFLTNPQRLNRYTYCLNSPVTYIDTQGLWGEDVHYGKTKNWAIEMGFNKDDADTIGTACKNIDTWTGETGAMPWGDQSRHFDIPLGGEDSRDIHAKKHMNKAVQYEILGEHKKAMEELGKGLHSIQDKISHKDWDTSGVMPGGYTFHPLGPGGYDDWNISKHKQERKATGRVTKQYLKEYQGKLKHIKQKNSPNSRGYRV